MSQLPLSLAPAAIPAIRAMTQNVPRDRPAMRIAMVDVTRAVSLHKFHIGTLHGRDMLDRSDRDAARQALGGEDARMCDNSASYEIRLIVRPVVRLPCCVLQVASGDGQQNLVPAGKADAVTYSLDGQAS